jgi:hypothetical protein
VHRLRGDVPYRLSLVDQGHFVLTAATFEDFSLKEAAAWIGGMLVAAAIVVLVMIQVVDYIAPHDAGDPLVNQGGLKPEQEPKIGK